METKYRILIIRYRREISAVLAGLGVLILISIIRSLSPTVPVIVAGSDLPAGSKLSANDFGKTKIPSSLGWPGIISNQELIIGKVTSHAIDAGQPFSKSDLISSDLLAGFSDNKIAISIPLGPNRSEAFLTSGNHINVYAAQSGMAAELVAFNAVVLFIPQNASSAFNFDSSGEKSLILAVNQSESAAIAAYIGNGTFTFALLPNS
jgi:Flp pilus assembly protein CpaB